LVTELLPTYISNIPNLSWKKYATDNSWSFDYTDCTITSIAAFKSKVSSLMSNIKLTFAFTGDLYASPNPDGTGAIKIDTLNINVSMAMLMEEYKFTPFQTSAPGGGNPYCDIRNVHLRISDSDEFNIHLTNDKTIIPHLRESDVLDLATNSINQGTMVLTDPNGEVEQWTDANWHWFLDALAYVDASDLVTQLTAGSVYIDQDPEAPLYHYTVSNIDAGVFCSVKPEYAEAFGTNVDALIDTITFQVNPNNNTLVNITIKTHD
jgi:hypothetical protein